MDPTAASLWSALSIHHLHALGLGEPQPPFSPNSSWGALALLCAEAAGCVVETAGATALSDRPLVMGLLGLLRQAKVSAGLAGSEEEVTQVSRWGSGGDQHCCKSSSSSYYKLP